MVVFFYTIVALFQCNCSSRSSIAPGDFNTAAFLQLISTNLVQLCTHSFANKFIKLILKSSIFCRTFMKTFTTGLCKKYANATSTTVDLSSKQAWFWFLYIFMMQLTRFSTSQSSCSQGWNRWRASAFNSFISSWPASMKTLGCFKRSSSSFVSIESMACKLLEIQRFTKPFKCHGSLLKVIPFV